MKKADKKFVADKKLYDFTKLLIYDSREPNKKIDISIGNYTIQYFANIYLNRL